MPTLTKTTEGTVTGLWGSALIVGSDGKMKKVKMGDVLRQGDHILTSQDGIVQLTPLEAPATTVATGAPAEPAPVNEFDFDKLGAPAAGLSGGDSGSLSEGFRVGRIAEGLTPASLTLPSDGGNVTFERPTPNPSDTGGGNGTPAAAPPPANLPPSALPGSASGPEDTPLPVHLGGQDPDGTVVSVTVTVLPAHGTLLLADGVTPVAVGVALTPEQAGSLVFRPEADYNGPAQVQFTVTDNSGATSTPAPVDINLLPVNDAPVASDDSNRVTEDSAVTTLVVSAANGVIQSAGNPAGRDVDPDGDALSIVAVRTGTEASGTSTAGTVGGALVGTYGTLTLNADGSYTYALANGSPQVQNLSAGEVVRDVFTYTVSDGHGGTDTAVLTINVTGSQDLTAGPPTLTPVAVSGLNGSYYGYNDTATNDPSLRTHADDGTAVFGTHGVTGNLNSVEDLDRIINGRDTLAGGTGNITGTSVSPHSGAADVIFTAHTLDYGFNPVVNATLGSNTNLPAGATLPGGDGDPNSSTHGLANFLGTDAPTTLAQVGSGSTNGGSGLGTTTDAAMRFAGQIYVQPGSYDFRVTGDDGFRLRVAGETLLEYDGNQWPTSRVFNHVPLGDLGGGLQSFELLYWEQNGNARLRIEYKPSGAPDSEFQVMSDTNTGLFSNEAAPVLEDPRIQDMVYDAANGWQIRTGSILDGDASSNTLVGGISRDLLRGGDGNDILYGNGGADQLEGGAGNDQLYGGEGNDLLIGGSGDNLLVGGNGDDTYRLSDGNDTLVENANEGIDTLQLDAAYVSGHAGSTFILAENFENLTAQGADAINLVGNSADNRLIGNSADNFINGGLGNDLIVGDQGNDTLTGGTGGDVFAWRLADGGAPGGPAVDTITDFTYGGGHSNIEAGTSGQPIGGGDVLDLRDLLQGEHTSVGGLDLPTSEVQLNNLTNYIDVEVSNGSTVLHISSSGGFTDGTFNPSAEDERIVLQDVDLYAATGVSSGDENALLQTLLKNGTMIVD